MRSAKEIQFGAVFGLIGVFVFGAGAAALAQDASADPAVGYGELSLAVPPQKGEPTSVPLDAPKLTLAVSPLSPIHGTNLRIAGGPGTGTQSEISLASSGPSIVVTFNGGPRGSGFVTSVDGGVTFSPVASFPSPPSANPCCDPVQLADSIGRFYFIQIYRNDGNSNCTDSVHLSTDGGRTFGGIIGSPFSYAFGTPDFPDQPHAGIDRVNLVNGQPQIYVSTRHFTSGINCPQTGTSGSVQGEIVCSSNGGTTWSGPIVLSPFTDISTFGVGSDGSVYTAGFGSGDADCDGDGTNDTARILLRRSVNRCSQGLSFGTPVIVASNVTFGATGVDRENAYCTVLVDRLNPNVCYVVWSSDRLVCDGDRDILISRCTFSGTAGSCQPPVRVNDNPIADNTPQFFPMACIDPNNVINISWDDARAGGGSTAIFHTEIHTTGGALAVAPNYMVSEVNFVPFNFGGSPDYGDYNENNDACDANHFYVAWTSHVSPPGITPASTDPDVFFSVVNNLSIIHANAPLDFGSVCVGSTQTRTLELFNTGDAPLIITNISRISGSPAITIDPNPPLPVNISPDAHVDFTVRCTPSSAGPTDAVIRVLSNDPYRPQLDLNATFNGTIPTIATVMDGGGRYGNVCRGTYKDLQLTIANSGGCDLLVNNITSSSPEFLLSGVNSFPLRIQAGTAIHVTIRLAPSSLGTKSANITITHNDPSQGPKIVMLSGNVPPGSLRLTGSTDFGDVCGGALAEKVISICNVGTCNLNVSSVTFVPPCPDFTLINNPFPAAVSPDFCAPLTVRFTPSSCGGLRSCTLRIITDDPNALTNTVTVTASTPCASIDVPPDVCFPPTVIQSVGACSSLKPFPISNTGTCPLKITAITLGGANPAAYTFVGLPSFPIILEQGHVVGEGNFKIGFIPTVLARDTLATISVTYEDDPVSHHTTTVTRVLNGEGVRTGARVLVLGNGVPVANVEKLMIQRITGNRNKPLLNTVDNAMNLPVTTVTPASPCGQFKYHREYSTVSNPIQLLPGSYQITATAYVNGKKYTKAIGFDVSTCTFNPNIVISLP